MITSFLESPKPARAQALEKIDLVHDRLECAHVLSSFERTGLRALRCGRQAGRLVRRSLGEGGLFETTGLE